MNQQPRTEMVDFNFEKRAKEICDIYNQGDVYKTYVKKNCPKSVKVLNEDGTINETMEYGSKEYKVFISEFVKKHDNGLLKALSSDGTTIVNAAVYNSIENKALLIEPEKYTFVKDGTADFNPLKRDAHEVKMIGKYGLVTPPPKSWDRLYEKFIRFAHIPNHSDEDSLNLKFYQKEGELFNKVHDYVRFTVITPDYQAVASMLGYFLSCFGGQIEIVDEAHSNGKKDTYQGIHWNGQIDGVNVEVQWHTLKNLEFKGLDDWHYHAHVNDKSDERSPAEEEKMKNKQILKKFANDFFPTTGFQEAVPMIEDLIHNYEDIKGATPKLTPKLKHFVMYAQKAEMVHDKFAGMLIDFLREYSKIEDMTIIPEKAK